MATDLRCPKCGSSNALTQMFCHNCGGKLNLSSVQARDLKQHGGQFVAGLRGIVRGVLTGALTIALLLLVWPDGSAGVRGGSKEAVVMTNKIKALQRAQRLKEHQEVIFSEGELNAYMAKLVDESNEGLEEGARPALKEIRFCLRDGVTALTIFGQWGPVPVSMGVVARPEIREGQLRFVITNGHFGRLPLTAIGGRLIRHKIEKMFAAATAQRELLQALTACRPSYGRARVAVGTGS